MQGDNKQKNKLKAGIWTNTLVDLIYEKYRFNCAWSFKSHEIPKNINADYFFHFNFNAVCSEKNCKTKMRGKVIKHKKKILYPLEYGLNVKLYLTGNYNTRYCTA